MHKNIGATVATALVWVLGTLASLAVVVSLAWCFLKLALSITFG